MLNWILDLFQKSTSTRFRQKLHQMYYFILQIRIQPYFRGEIVLNIFFLTFKKI